MRMTYISVVNGRNRKPRHGMMTVPKAAFINAGRANQANSSVMRENDAMKAVRHPELLFVFRILTPFPFRQ